jgi:hypothetical protein
MGRKENATATCIHHHPDVYQLHGLLCGSPAYVMCDRIASADEVQLDVAKCIFQLSEKGDRDLARGGH